MSKLEVSGYPHRKTDPHHDALESRVEALEQQGIAIHRYVTGAMKEVLDGILDASNDIKEASKGVGLGAVKTRADGDINWQPANRDPSLDTIGDMFLVYAIDQNGEGDYILCHYNCGRFHAEFDSRHHFAGDAINDPAAWAHLAAP